MSFEIAIIIMYLGSAAIFAWLSMQTNQDTITGAWFKILFMVLMLIMFILAFDFGSKIINFEQQTNVTITGYPSNVTIYDNLRTNVFQSYFMIIPIVVLMLSFMMIGLISRSLTYMKEKKEMDKEDPNF